MDHDIDINTPIDEYEHQLVLAEPTDNRDAGDTVWGGAIHPEDIPNRDGETMSEQVESIWGPVEYEHHE